MTTAIHGVTWLLVRAGSVLLERCPKKRIVLGVGEWFVPGGKIEDGETPERACRREMREEWGVQPLTMLSLPLVEGSRVPPGPHGIFLMRPFLVTIRLTVAPARTVDEGIELRWVPLDEALWSPVPQVRMMVAGVLPYNNADRYEALRSFI